MKLTTRHLVRGRGQHRVPSQRPEGALVGQQFVHCGQCGGVESAATRHGTALLCTEGHLVPAGGAL